MDFVKKIILYFKLFRICASVVMNMFIFIPLLISLKNFAYAAILTFPFVLMIGGEIALNDYFDVEKDRINKPQRPLTSGKIKLNQAFMVITIVLCVSILLGVLIYRNNIYRLLIFFILMLGLTCYNIKCPFVAICKTFITASAVTLALSFIMTFSIYDNNYIYFLYAAFFFILSRELLMDIRDIKGDQAENYITLAIILGKNKTLVGSFIFMAISNIFCCIYIYHTYNISKIFLITLCLFIEIFVCYNFTFSDNTRQQNKLALLLWCPMILMLFILI